MPLQAYVHFPVITTSTNDCGVLECPSNSELSSTTGLTLPTFEQVIYNFYRSFLEEIDRVKT